MIKGIGLDIVELDRIKKTNERFVARVLTPTERDIYEGLSESRKVEFLAGRFSAKEAFSKANGTGIGKDCSFQQIEILKDERGKPVLYFDGKLTKGFVSITHTQTVAAAQVVLLQSDDE